MEIMELKNHPFYAAVQYHPEYLSRPMRPSPPYLGLILAATGKLEAFIAKGQEISEANFLILISSQKNTIFLLDICPMDLKSARLKKKRYFSMLNRD
jgi:hypothetical protein